EWEREAGTAERRRPFFLQSGPRRIRWSAERLERRLYSGDFFLCGQPGPITAPAWQLRLVGPHHSPSQRGESVRLEYLQKDIHKRKSEARAAQRVLQYFQPARVSGSESKHHQCCVRTVHDDNVSFAVSAARRQGDLLDSCSRGLAAQQR